MKLAYRRRLVDDLLVEILGGLPAAMLVGPRGSGKTTTARQHARSIVRLDREQESLPFAADPDTMLREYDEPLLLDEWQLVPEVLPAIKRAIDDDGGTGRFLLTGSVRAEMIKATWAATGRVVRVEQWGMCQRELVGDPTAPSFFDRVLHDGIGSLPASPAPFDLRDYIDLAVRGMFPEVALQPSASLRQRWLSGYLDQLLLRDASLIDERRDPVRLRRYLTALAAHTAGVVDHKSVFDAAGVTRDTAVAYDSLLELMFVTDRLPAWHSNQLNRLTRGPKRYVVEPALCGVLLGVDASAVIRNADLLGRFVDTLVLSQLRPELATAKVRPMLYHLRRDDGTREVDLVVEWPDGRVLGVEVKASAAPKPDDARHLVWLRDQLGDLFIGGIVFHTGPKSFELSAGVRAVPIAGLWTA